MPLADTRWTTLAELERPDGHAIYARKSQNRDGRSQSVPAQIEEDREFNESRGWNQNDEFTFSDDNISASEYSTKDRPEFELLCAVIRSGQVWTLTVTEVSRITRAVPMAVDFVKLAKESGGLIVYTTEGKQFDITTTTGEHDFYDAVVEASRESGKTSDRVKRNKSNVAKEGRYHGGRTRYGRVPAIKDQFGRVTNTGEAGIAIEEHQAIIINETLQRIVDGWPFVTIVKDLLQRGEKWVNGKPIPVQGFRTALLSPHIIGARVYHGRIVKEDAYPPIALKPLWEKATAILKAEDRAKGSNKGIRTYPLTGSAYCSCGNGMIGHNRTEKGKGKARTYVCPLYDRHGRKVGCGKRRLADPLELFIKDAVIERLSKPEIVSALKQVSHPDEGGSGLSLLLEKAQGIQQRLDELEDFWTKGTEGLDFRSMLRMKANMETDLDGVNTKIERLSARSGAAMFLTTDIREAFEHADAYQAGRLVGLVIEKIVVLPQGSRGKRRRWTHETSGRSWWFNPDNIEITWKYLSLSETVNSLSKLLKQFR